MWDEEGEALGVKDFCIAMLLDGEADGEADGHADGDGVIVGVTVTVTIIIAAEEGISEDMAPIDDDGDAIIIIDMGAEDEALFLPRPWRKAAGISPPLYSAAMAEPAKAATDKVNKFWAYIVK